ncbi:MAG: T9SS type A sorting domain-containing protein [Bacteroidetes bacterium]|nr:MAG: T9SS type A sorting domain-containing protein [Bacteroidota bacterium]
MLKKTLILVLLLFFLKANAEKFLSEIEIETLNPLPGKVTPLFFGSFIEFIKNYMNGPFGMTAQELVDRGFDMEYKYSTGIAYPWKSLSLDSAEGNWSLIQGGFNKRGKYSQYMERTNALGTFGIYQHIFLTDSTANDFYIYFKGDQSVNEVILTLYDSSFNNKLYTVSLGKPDSGWRKSSVTIPYLPGRNYAFLALTIIGVGSVELDESSFMAQNNVSGVRNEHYKFFKDLKPGILRYPGGCFADLTAAHWEYGIGKIDQRTSPNLCYEEISQRLDFGTDELIEFCRLIGAEPHLTVNFANGTPAEAAAWVEYCNGDTNTKYGAMRAANGHPEPYNVKYWEVGNEQYVDSINMAKRYLLYYDAMKTVDSSIIIMIDGNIWKGFDYYNALMGVAGSKVDIYGWHHGNVSDKSDELSYHLHFISGPIVYVEICLTNVFKWLTDSSFYPKTKQGSTEWWSIHEPGWVNDVRSWNMETAYVDALNLHVYMRNPESFVLAERTTFVESGILISRYDTVSQKRRVFAGAPYYSSMLMSNHSGNTSYPLDIMSPTFDVPEDKFPWSPKNVKWLDAVATSTDDTLFLSVVNRHSSDTSGTLISFDFIPDSMNTVVYELSSPNYLDRNSPSEPYKIVPKSKTINFKKYYDFLPNSFTILAFPRSEINGVDDNSSELIFGLYISPNPFEDEIMIRSVNSFELNYEFYLFDLLGNLVKNVSITGLYDYYSLNTSDLCPGPYTLKISNGKKVINKLLIKI